MAAPLMKSVSGIRGVVGESLTPELVMSVASAFAAYTRRGMVVVGRDSRPTGEAISGLVCSTLVLSGCRVIEIGVVPTPTVQVMVEHLKAAGGMVISASHNPIQWNAFKLIGKTGMFLNAREIAAFFALMERARTYPRWDGIGGIENNGESHAIHIRKVLAAIDAPLVRAAKFRVALDSVNGAGSLITQSLLKELGCEVRTVHCQPDGLFPRGAEPLAENLGDLAALVRRERADVGFAQDPDADRLAIVDETGRPIGEENTLALVTEHMLSIKPGRVVINLSTTRAVEDIAKNYGAKVKRTRVGEINVADEMRRGGARIGGEGNGGVISPDVHLGRDSLAGIACVLEMMARRKMTVSGLASRLPAYVMRKGKVPAGKAGGQEKRLAAIAAGFAREKITDIDGLRIDFVREGPFRGGWVHLRSSNTEPIFRIIAEGRNDVQADAIYGHFTKMFSDKKKK